MNKDDIIKTVTEKTDGFKKKDITVIVDMVFDTIKNTLASGEKVSIAGFGSFTISERAARIGKNPQTSEEIMIPASKSPKFKASKAFKEIVNA